MGQVKKLDIAGFESRIEGDNLGFNAFSTFIKADNELVKADQILSDCGIEGITPIGYSSRAEKISLLFDDACKLINYPTDLVEGLTGVDARFAAGVQNALRALDTIRIDDIRIKNDFGVTRKEQEFDEYEFTYKEVLKEDLTLDDFVGYYDSLSSYGTSYVKGFTDLLYSPYITDEKDLQDIVTEKSDEIHELLYGEEFENYSNIIAVMGYDPIMEEILSIEDMKRAALSGGYYSLLKGPSCGATKGVIAYLSTLEGETASMPTSEVFTCLGAKELNALLLSSCRGIAVGNSIINDGVTCRDYYILNREEIEKRLGDIADTSSDNNGSGLNPVNDKAKSAIIAGAEKIFYRSVPKYVSNEEMIHLMYLGSLINTSEEKTENEKKLEKAKIVEKGLYTRGEYIENQEKWVEVKYGNKNMAFSGCEIIAVINALHSMGYDMKSEDVVDLISKFEGNGAISNGKWGTSPVALVDYLRNEKKCIVKCTKSTNYEEIEKVVENSDTIIVTLYNEKDDLSKAVHTINIEKSTDDEGKAVFYNHNVWARDVNDEFCRSDPYYSLEDAIKDSHHTNNSAPIMVMGISKPIDGFTESED